jgi:hypothetical protein
MRDAVCAVSGKEAKMLRPELNLKGVSDAWKRDKTPSKNNFSEITPSPAAVVKSAVTVQGELTYANPIRRNVV